MAPAGYGDRVEGLHAVAAAAAAGRVQRLLVERSRLRRAEVGAIVASLPSGRVEEVDDVRPFASTEAPQGLVAECRPLASVPLESFTSERPALLVLDHVEDPHNVGAVARSALAAGMTGMVVSARRAAPLSATAFKAAAGALETLPVAVVGSIPETLSRLHSLGVWTVGLDGNAESNLFGLELLAEPVALVLGAEGVGLRALVRKRCEVLASIPIAGDVESLNVSVAAALASFEVMRVRSTTQGRN